MITVGKGGGHRSYIGISRISDKDTIAGLEDWEHPYQTIKFDIGLVYRPELKNGGGLEMQIKDVYNHTEFQMVQGYCQPRPYPIQYAELDTNFAVYSISKIDGYFCSKDIYSGWVRLAKLINTKELVHIEGEFELTLYHEDNPSFSVELSGGRFYKKVYKTH